MKKLPFFLIACFVVMTSVVHAQELEATLDKIVDSYFHAGPGYAIRIDRNGETIYRKAVGMANLESDLTLKQNDIFRIGSITKQFTAVAILTLVERCQINLDDPLTKFIKDYPTKGEPITIEHLLTHTSGIKSYTSMDTWDEQMQKEDLSVDELINLFKGKKMDFKPGSEFKYNNSGYVLLGKIIEEVSGQSYADFLRTEFFVPLDMKDTQYEDDKTERVPGYSVGKNGEYIEAAYISMTQPYAAGALVSTVDDLSKWYHAIFADQVLSKEMREKAHTPYKLNKGKAIHYGYGWFLNKVDGSPVIMHGGGINGFSSASAFLPKEQLFIVVLSNCDHSPSDKLIKKIAGTALGKRVSMPKRIKVPEASLSIYKGTYNLAPENPIKIHVRAGKLVGKAPGQAEVELIPIGNHVFFIQQLEAKLKFNLNKNKVVKSLTLYENGVHLALKEE